MSRVLPPEPSLEFLKNEAKDLLAVLRQQSPGAKLADALHRLARDYGFPTWPVLKAHVESLRQSAEAPSPAPAANPLAGVWRLDRERSRLNAIDDVRDATIEITVTDATVAMTHRQRDSGGRTDESVVVFRADDEPHAAGDGYSMRARWRDRRALETIATHGGAIVGQGVYEVSADGRTLTIASQDAHANAHGWQMVDHVLVFDRQ